MAHSASLEPHALQWSGPAAFPGLVRISALGDGSCYFHAIAKGFFTPYRTGMMNGVPVDRREMIRKLRDELAIRLQTPVRPLDPTSPLVYDTLSGGQLRAFAEAVPEYKLEHMVQELRGGGAVDHAYHELVSNELDKDIYIVDSRQQDVVNLGNLDLFYKGRKSIVLCYQPWHYDLIGVQMDTGAVRTLFAPDDPYIQQLRTRLHQLSR